MSRNSSSQEKLLLINKLMLDGKISKALNLAEDELKDNKIQIYITLLVLYFITITKEIKQKTISKSSNFR